MSHPRLPIRSSSTEPAEIDDLTWVASPSESVIHARGPGDGLLCEHEVVEEPETCTGYLPASRWPGYQPHLACLAAAPPWVTDLVEPRAARPYGEEETVTGRRAIERVATLQMPGLAKRIKSFERAMAVPPTRPANENGPGSSYLPGTRAESSWTLTGESTMPDVLGEVA
ncbi:hypothetical protein SAMN05216215_103313 [Saccharopolyspora shandongensis]|uniref:Uncharacterized protein n=1 Tax=Saccharopolyspora shandongensis TaxID=418495 RepID=A0A1H3M347_9PSEU|nr:hypothetical protein [Saccharopolyspora shandongensis]SDY70455.1 hypothetical protein SAMN05216215_103313 [Saccharopolyspora shandongensis]